jgi:outer membrane usher protein
MLTYGNLTRLFIVLSVATSPSIMAAVMPSPPSNSPEGVQKDNQSEYIEFNDAFLMGGSRHADISRFSYGNIATAGDHKVEIYLNGKLRNIDIINFPDNGKGYGSPCLTVSILNKAGVETSTVTGAKQSCINLAGTIKDAQVAFDNNKQRLDIRVPQQYEKTLPPGYVDPSRWDSGINAGYLSWNWNAWHSGGHSDTSDTFYAGTDYGLNLGAWRFRANGTMNKSDGHDLEYNSNQLYIQHQVGVLHAQMIAGDTYTRSDFFDSLNLKGVRLYNDNRMLPGGDASYLPIIHGNARTNAKVTVRQQGKSIYQTTVTPGAFSLTGLNSAFSGGDLDVTVDESDGSQQHFTVPYSTVTQLQREGFSSWEAGMGKLDDNSLRQNPNLIMATWSHGLTNTFTGYTGFQLTDNNYYAGLLGLAVNTQLGAFAFDVTRTSMELPESQTWSGQSYRLSYSKIVDSTATSFNVAAWRYSTRHYLSLTNAMSLYDALSDDQQDNDSQFSNPKNEIQLNVNQPLMFDDVDHGSLYISSAWTSYWGNQGNTVNYSVGYSNAFDWGSYSISAQRTWTDDDQKNDSINISITVPLDSLLPGGNEQHHAFSSMTASYSTDLKGNDQLNSTASGSSDDNRTNYSVTGSLATHRTESNILSQISGSASYNTRFGPLSASLSSSSSGDRQASLGGTGGLVVHRHGVVFADHNISSNESLALLNAPGAEGSLTNLAGASIDSSGYGLSGSLTPYGENSVGLDISTIKQDVAIDSTSATVVPTEGAITLVKFDTQVGQSWLMPLRVSMSESIPMGATVYNEQGNDVGIVGQGEQAFVRGIAPSGTLTVKWDNGHEQQCLVPYRIANPQTSAPTTILLPEQQCVPPSQNIKTQER